MDYFEVFGLPRRLTIDADDLQRRFYELSRRYHPDFHAGAQPEAQARALEDSARLNAAYRALRDPAARIDYLIRLTEGRATREGAADRPTAPPELLAEMFEIQESLAEAKAGGLDEATRKTLQAQRERLVSRLDDEEARLTGPLAAAWDAAADGERPRLMQSLKQGLATRAYLRTVIEDLSAVLGDAQAPEVE